MLIATSQTVQLILIFIFYIDFNLVYLILSSFHVSLALPFTVSSFHAFLVCFLSVVIFCVICDMSRLFLITLCFNGYC